MTLEDLDRWPLGVRVQVCNPESRADGLTGVTDHYPPDYQEHRVTVQLDGAGRYLARADELEDDGMTTTTLVQSERQFQDAVVQYARLHHWLIFHPYDSRRSTFGYPDLTMVRDGRLIFAELKAAKGRLKPEQAAWLTALEQVDGVETYLWRPDSWDDLCEVLR